MRQKTWTPKALIAFLLTVDQEKRYVLKDYDDWRTGQQNRYLHLVFDAIGQEWWETPDQVKEYLKSLFLKEFIMIKWIELPVVKWTAKLKKKEFWVFVEKIRHWWLTHLNMTIPSPEDERLWAFYAEYWLN